MQSEAADNQAQAQVIQGAVKATKEATAREDGASMEVAARIEVADEGSREIAIEAARKDAIDDNTLRKTLPHDRKGEAARRTLIPMSLVCSVLDEPDAEP